MRIWQPAWWLSSNICANLTNTVNSRVLAQQRRTGSCHSFSALWRSATGIWSRCVLCNDVVLQFFTTFHILLYFSLNRSSNPVSLVSLSSTCTDEFDHLITSWNIQIWWYCSEKKKTAIMSVVEPFCVVGILTELGACKTSFTILNTHWLQHHHCLQRKNRWSKMLVLHVIFRTWKWVEQRTFSKSKVKISWYW